MTYQQEFKSWKTPSTVIVSPEPEVGTTAPTSKTLSFPNASNKPAIVTFLRHCGCPFAEKTFKDLRQLADIHNDVEFIAVSHSEEQSTDKWIISVGGHGKIKVLIDSHREVYAQWGLGVSSAWHVLNPWSLWNVFSLGNKEQIWNRPTESGSRWQTAGSFAVGNDGIVKWTRVAPAADDIPNFIEALQSVGA